jgi:hypothetical protein
MSLPVSMRDHLDRDNAPDERRETRHRLGLMSDRTFPCRSSCWNVSTFSGQVRSSGVSPPCGQINGSRWSVPTRFNFASGDSVMNRRGAALAPGIGSLQRCLAT